MKKFLSLSMLAAAVLSGTAWADSDEPCEISAHNSDLSGVSFSGSLTNDGIDFLVDWRHSAPGVEFETAAADPDQTRCDIDPISLIAHILGTGTATLNSEPAFRTSFIWKTIAMPRTPSFSHPQS